MRKMENVADIYPLTPLQQGMLYHTLSEPESEVYFEQIRCSLIGPLNVPRLMSAWSFVIDHYPALRTAFLWEQLDEPLQVVRQTVSASWKFIDWRKDRGDTATRLDQLAQDNRRSGFDVAKAPLLSFVLIHVANETFHFIWNFHHLLLDGWSTHQVFNDAFTTYEMLGHNRQPFLPPTRPFRSYIAWLKKQDIGEAERFWRKKLAGFDAPTPLHVDKNAIGAAIIYGEKTKELPETTSTALTLFAKQNRITLNSVIQGAWALLLSRYSGQNDVLFGNTVSGRPAELPGVERMVGMCINTLPVRVKLLQEQPLVPWLQQIQEQQMEARRYEYSPLVKVQQWSGIATGRALFESIVVFENYPVSNEDARRSLQIRNIQYRELSNYPLALLVLPGARLRLLVIYNRNRFEQDTVDRLMNHLQTILEAMVARSHQTLAEIPMLDKSEMEQLLVLWNRTDSPIVPDDPLFKSVAKHAARSPNATAVIAQDKVLTYAQLDSRANQLANYLIENGIGPGTAVGLYVERSTSMLVGIIGIQKAGGAYVPLDPAYPAERIALILEDAQIPVIVAQMDIVGQLPALDAEIIELDSSYECFDGVSTVAPKTVVTLDDLAYIIYTSGSTGKPKGVMVTQRNLLASTMAREAYYEEPVRRYLLLSSFAFDSSVAGIFWTLASGGALVLPAPDDEKDVRKLASLIANEKVTHTLALPSLYRLLLAYAPPGSLESLQVVIVAGEACPPDMGERHFALLPETGLYNEYGPTEATVWCSVYNLPREGDDGPVPIGRPIANTKLFILDQREQPVPIGVPGELCVGGAGLTAGYWNNAELTADRYPTLAFEGHKEIGRVYRTGDLARWRADGQIEYLGRVDNQVKIRGFRVELGEIEALLLRHPDVEEAVATVQELPGLNGSAERILVAYATGAWSEQGTNGEAAQLQAYLSERLPEYMVPRQVVWLPEMPHTPNGKVDRNRLPQSQIERDGKRPFVAPRNAAEETLVRIWREILGLPEIGIEDKFFELGGDSLKLIQVIARAGQEGLELAPRQLLEGQTIKRLAAIAANGVGPSKEPVLIPLNQEGTKSPVFFVHGISGSVVWLTNVLPLLKLDQPTFGLQSVGLQSGNEPDTSIEAMATRYLESVRRLQPSGPYYFGGFCFGGIVAYEMARQLEQLGERTALLAIIDAFPSQTVRRKRPLYDPLRLRIIRESAPYWFRGYKALGGWQRLRSRIFSKFDWDPGPQPDPDFEFEILAELDYMADYLATRREIQLQINDVNRRAQYEYEPQAYGGQITLFYPRLLGVGQALFGPIDPQREWSSLAKDGVSIRYVESSHVNLLRKPFVSDLAAQLNDALLSNQLMSRAKVEA